MANFRWDIFKGIRPRQSARLLTHGEAQTAENIRLGSGSLEPWNDKLATGDEVAADAISIHKMDNGGSPIWLSSTNDVDYARGPVPNDELERTYYTGEAQPRMTYTTIAASDYRYLGIPAPTTAPTLVGDALPPASVTGTMTANSMVTNTLKADFTIQDNLPASVDGWFMGEDSGYDPPGTVRVFNMDFFVGQEIRVASIVDANTITIEDANGGTYLVAGVDQSRAEPLTHFRTDDTGTSRDGYFRFYVPNGVKITVTAHNLEVDDVIRITSIPSTIALQLTQEAVGAVDTGCLFGWESDNAGGTAGSNTWPAAPISVAADSFWIAGARAYPFVDVYSDADGLPGTDMFMMLGNFSWELVERGGVSYESVATDIESRVYVYTFVSELGEEGPPSPASEIVTIPTQGEVVVSGFDTPPSTKRNITDMRIYRANSGTDQTVFQFVAEIPSPFADYTDDVLDIELGELLQTESWDPPETDMVGLTALPNGGMAGFFGKTVAFSEPYYPHAWPPEYQIAVDYDIVGLGVVPNGVAILTKGPVYIASGDHPRAMSLRHFNDSQACSSKRSIVSTINGVLYSAPDGLAFVGASGFELVTQNHITKREWQASFEPTAIRAFWHDSKYIGFHTTGGLVYSPSDEFIGLTTHDVVIEAGYHDAEEDTLYITVEEANSPLFVAVSGDTDSNTTQVMTSPDGITWTLQTNPTERVWSAVAYSPDLEIFAAVASQNITSTVMTSFDGVTWTLRAVDPSGTVTFTAHDVIWVDDLSLFIATGTSTTAGDRDFMTSSDGITWTAQADEVGFIGLAIVYADHLAALFAIDDNENVHTSTDGSVWTDTTANRPGGAANTVGMAYSPTLSLIVAAASTAIYYSSDGTTWSTSASVVSGVADVIWAAELGLFVAVGTGATRIYTSPDGVTWTGRTSTVGANAAVYSADLNLLVTVGNAATDVVATSPDGITWTARSTPGDAFDWHDVTIGGTAADRPIYEWDADVATQLTLLWKSGRVVCNYPLNLSAARVIADAYPVTLRLYNDQGDLVTTRTITSEEVIRLPGGYLTNWFEVEIESTEAVRAVHIAETVTELLQG